MSESTILLFSARYSKARGNLRESFKIPLAQLQCDPIAEIQHRIGLASMREHCERRIIERHGLACCVRSGRRQVGPEQSVKRGPQRTDMGGQCRALLQKLPGLERMEHANPSGANPFVVLRA